MGVPTRDQIIGDLKIPEVEKKRDNMGRPVEKKNYNYGRGSKIFVKYVSDAHVKYVRSAFNSAGSSSNKLHGIKTRRG